MTPTREFAETSRRSGFDQETFEQYLTMRVGIGEPVYWYGSGVVNSYPDGHMICRMEGIELARLYRPDPMLPLAYQYSRNFVVFRNSQTDEIVRDASGQPQLIAEPYQYSTYTLDGDVLRYEVERGCGSRLLRISGGENTEVRRAGDLTIITSPAWLDTSDDPHWEKYDFIISGAGNKRPDYHIVWGRYGPDFTAQGSGFATSHMWLYRHDHFEELPESIRLFILSEPGMGLWKEPPRDLDEIRSLQAAGDQAAAAS